MPTETSGGCLGGAASVRGSLRSHSAGPGEGQSQGLRAGLLPEAGRPAHTDKQLKASFTFFNNMAQFTLHKKAPPLRTC